MRRCMLAATTIQDREFTFSNLTIPTLSGDPRTFTIEFTTPNKLSVIYTKEDRLSESSFNGFEMFGTRRLEVILTHSLQKGPISTRAARWLVATTLLFSQLNVRQNISAKPFQVILQFQVCLGFCDNCSRKGWVGKGYQRENE